MKNNFPKFSFSFQVLELSPLQTNLFLSENICLLKFTAIPETTENLLLKDEKGPKFLLFFTLCQVKSVT